MELVLELEFHLESRNNGDERWRTEVTSNTHSHGAHSHATVMNCGRWNISRVFADCGWSHATCHRHVPRPGHQTGRLLAQLLHALLDLHDRLHHPRIGHRLANVRVPHLWHQFWQSRAKLGTQTKRCQHQATCEFHVEWMICFAASGRGSGLVCRCGHG